MDKFSNLPAPLRWFLGVTGLGALISAGWFGSRGGVKLLLIFGVILLVLVLVLVGGYLLYGMWKRKKQSAQLGGDLRQSTSAAPRGMSATDLATLDNLRKKFQEGIDAFRSRGKDMYTLPWYVIIGEPGSGKTEAVRHCNVGFPPGMHEGENDAGYMGAGGTINMNWWFTNFAVLLDTAGKMIFNDVKPGETSEWKEFLKLLKKNRPNCPINGLILVIPSDSLIRDSADQIAAKAGKIAQQLDVIQRVLDFRFPVYVAITKSDKINGFREFFEGVTDPQLQHQMLGWSNPEPLDSGFKADLVDKHLAQVAERLRRRRLGLMRDPVPEGTARRIDEVDSLFALPNSLLMLAPRLRSYLDKIFLPGEWSAKPLFLRGIYFTSSMREGAALDQELAEAIGVPPDDLPEGKVWERERAYFLRDLFVEKVFKEKGLVTRATNTKRLLRRRQVIIYACSAAALTIFVVLAWLGMSTVRRQVGDRAAYWVAATNAGWDENGSWKRPIVKVLDEGGYALVATNSFASEKMTPGQLQQKFRELAETDIKGTWLMPTIASDYNKKSKLAQRVLFETGVLKPVVDAASDRIRHAGTNEPYLPDALIALIHLDSEVQTRAKKGSAPLDAASITNLLGPLIRCAVNGGAAVDANLVSAMLWTYTGNPAGEKAWPPAWLSGTTTNKDSGITNPVIMAGLDYFIHQATNTAKVMATNWAIVEASLAALREYEPAEKALFSAVQGGKDEDVKASIQALDKPKGNVDAKCKATGGSTGSGPLSLTNLYATFTNDVTRFAVGAFDKVQSENAKARKEHPDNKVFEEVDKRLTSQKLAITGAITNYAPPEIWGELVQKDAGYLAGSAYERRWGLYQEAQKFASATPFQGAARADLPAKLRDWLDAKEKFLKHVGEYSGYESSNVVKLAEFFATRAYAARSAEFLVAYQQAATADLTPKLGFPLLWAATKSMDGNAFDAVCQTLSQIAQELGGIRERKFSETKEWQSFTNRVLELGAVARAIQGVPGQANRCSLSLLTYDDSDVWRKTYRGIKLVVGSDPSRMVDTSNSEEEKFADADLRKALRFQLFKLKDQPNPETDFGVSGEDANWGPLRLVLKYRDKLGADGVWTVIVPMADRGGGKLGLRLKFDQPLPDFEQHWPKE